MGDINYREFYTECKFYLLMKGGLQLGLLSDAASAKGTERRRFGQASTRLKRLRVRGYRVFPQFPA